MGQPDAGALMSGGKYTLQGGFWAIQALQTPGAPLLSITRTTTNTVVVSWPSPSTGFVLQQNTNSISSVNWSNAPAATDNGTIKYLLVNPPNGNRFYRLWKPLVRIRAATLTAICSSTRRLLALRRASNRLPRLDCPQVRVTPLEHSPATEGSKGK